MSRSGAFGSVGKIEQKTTLCHIGEPMKHKIISTQHAPAAIGPYSQAISAGGFLFTAGQIPLDPATGNLISGTVQAQTERVFENLKAVLQAANLDFSDVVKTTVFLTTMDHFQMMNEIYSKYLGDFKPARSTVAVAGLPKGALVEIEIVAKEAK